MASTPSRALATCLNRLDGHTLICREPVEFLSGRGAHLFGHDGRDYLDG